MQIEDLHVEEAEVPVRDDETLGSRWIHRGFDRGEGVQHMEDTEKSMNRLEDRGPLSQAGKLMGEVM